MWKRCGPSRSFGWMRRRGWGGSSRVAELLFDIFKAELNGFGIPVGITGLNSFQCFLCLTIFFIRAVTVSLPSQRIAIQDHLIGIHIRLVRSSRACRDEGPGQKQKNN